MNSVTKQSRAPMALAFYLAFLAFLLAFFLLAFFLAGGFLAGAFLAGAFLAFLVDLVFVDFAFGMMYRDWGEPKKKSRSMLVTDRSTERKHIV